MLLKRLDSQTVQRCIELTQVILDEFGLSLAGDANLRESWQQFWHITRTVEWPWALSWFEPGMKVFDVGSDPLFSLFLLNEGAEDVTLHHTSQDTKNLGGALIHCAGWVSLHDVWMRHDRKLKMVWGYPDQFDLKPASYDLVYNLSVMEHVEAENWQSWMEATWKLLKPGGIMVMSCDFLVQDAPGPEIDITNHPLNEFFDHVDPVYLSPVNHIPWHARYDGSLQKEDVLRIPHPANPEGLFTVYGFAVRKRDEGAPLSTYDL